MFFQLPKFLKIPAHLKTNGPIVIFAFDRVFQRLSLRVALDTDVIRLNEFQACGIHNVRTGRLPHVRRSRSMALFAAHIPLGYALVLDVVVDRMAAVTEWTRGTLHIVIWIKSGPPISAGGHLIGAPQLMGYVPLGAKGKVIVAFLREIALLPLAAVDEGNIILRELHQRIRF